MKSAGKQKTSVSIVYTGEGKGKTSASIGLVCRALGHGNRVAFIQFIKAWPVSEDCFFENIKEHYKDQLLVYKGGRGFYNAGSLSADGVSEEDHKSSAIETYRLVMKCAIEGDYDIVVCDEINNAVYDGLISEIELEKLITSRHTKTSLCLTGRNFPPKLVPTVDIVTEMQSTRHHFDDGFVANIGIDY